MIKEAKNMPRFETPPVAPIEEPRFGDDFHLDDTNRLDALSPTKKAMAEPLHMEADEKEGLARAVELPEYVDLSRKLRSELRATIESQGWPECPEDIKSVDDLFLRAKDEVSRRWVDTANQVLSEEAKKWSESLSETKKTAEIHKILASPQLIDEALREQKAGVLEDMRIINPEAWRALILASSERQLAAIVLLRRWIKELPEASIQKLGMNRTELELFLDAGALLGKYIDHSYIKQIELADAPGGSTETGITGEDGAEYVYAPYRDRESDEVRIIPYVKVFRFEWPRLVSNLNLLADRTEDLLTAGKIPASYRDLPGYLRQMSEVYGSESVTLEEIKEMWEELSRRALALAESGCPILVNPQGCPDVAGAAEIVDAEIGLDFQTPAMAEMSQAINGRYLNSAQEISDSYRGAVKEPKPVPKVIVNNQPFAFGPNLHSASEAEADDELILVHNNVSLERADKYIPPCLERTLVGSPISPQDLGEAICLDTALHELAHTVLNDDDSRVKKRVGVNAEAMVLYELKAETLGMEIMLKRLDQEKPVDFKEIVTRQFIGKLGSLEDYLATKPNGRGTSGESYYYSGVAIIHQLLDKGILVEQGDKYRVTDPEAGLRLIAGMGREILERFCGNVTDDPKEVRKSVVEYVKGIRQQEKDEAMAKFIARVKK